MSEVKKNAFEAKRDEIKASNPKPYEKKEVVYDKENYVDTKLGDNEDKKEFTIRPIPLSNDSDEIFEEVYFHWDNKAKKSLVCPKHTKHVPEGTNRECPYCDIEEGFWEEYRGTDDKVKKESFKKSALENKAQASYIFRTIQRIDGVSKGPRFWKISEIMLDNIDTTNKQNEKYGIDIFDLKTGKDLLVNFKKEKNKTKFVNLVSDMVSTQAMENEKEMEQIVSDKKKWYQIFTFKSYEFMEIMAKGGDPWFHKPLDKWIDKKDLKALQEEADKKVEEQAEEIDESEYANEIEEEISNDKKNR